MCCAGSDGGSRDAHSQQSSPRTDEGKCGSYSSSKHYNLKLIMDTCRLWGEKKQTFTSVRPPQSGCESSAWSVS